MQILFRPIINSLLNFRQRNSTLRVRVSTSRAEETRFRLVVQLVPFYLRLGEGVEGVEVTTTGPELFYFTFPPGVPEVRIRYSS